MMKSFRYLRKKLTREKKNHTMKKKFLVNLFNLWSSSKQGKDLIGLNLHYLKQKVMGQKKDHLEKARIPIDILDILHT